MRCDLAMLQIIAGEFSEAEHTIDATHALFPGNDYAHICLAILHEARGDFSAAVRFMEQVPADSPEAMMVMGLRYAFIGLAGDTAAAEFGLKQLKTARQETFVPASQIAMAALGCKDYDAAVLWLTQGAVVERDPVCIWLNILPFLRHLREHSGFYTLVTETIGLTFTTA